MNSKIVIIGAGVAGLAAATRAISLGFNNICILEGENRIGGRIHTERIGNGVVDLGAAWVHGEKKNAVWELTNKERSSNLFESTGTKYSSFKCCIRSNKEKIDQNISNRLNKIMRKYQDNENSLKDNENSLLAHLCNNYFNELERPENKDIDFDIAKEFYKLFMMYDNTLFGSNSPDDISSKGTLHYGECDGDLLLNWKHMGFDRFLDILIKSTKEEKFGILRDKIVLNKTVHEIKYPVKDDSDKKIKIICCDDDIIEADHVICTVSLGVLKENYSTMFKPSLPSNTINAIKGLSIGAVGKIFLEFKRPFWKRNWDGFSLLWRKNDLKDIRNRSDNWIEGVFAFMTLNHNDNVLHAWISGEKVKQMEKASNSEVLNGCHFLLNRFLTIDVPKPIDMIKTDWYRNKHFRGAFTFRSMETEKRQTSAYDLSLPICDNRNKPIIQFCGEATHDNYYSTVHGAVETGWREAQRLADFYTKE